MQTWSEQREHRGTRPGSKININNDNNDDDDENKKQNSESLTQDRNSYMMYLKSNVLIEFIKVKIGNEKLCFNSWLHVAASFMLHLF